MTYAKPWLTINDQLAKLSSRGMQVSDEARALDYLERIGYYRLSGYWYDFRLRSAYCPLDEKTGGKPKKVRIERPVLDEFKPGTRFQDAVDLYVFDKKLRLLVLDALERIEVALRVDLSHRLGEKDLFGYLKPALFHDNFAVKINPATGLTLHHDWLSKHAGLIVRSRETFMTHNKEKYGLPVAIWVACEVWDFGCMSTLFSGLQTADQNAIARSYGVEDGRVFASWLRSLNYLRNVCAHHSRLWNRNVVDAPKLPALGQVTSMDGFIRNESSPLRTRPFLLLCICQHLMQFINPSSSWGSRLKKHLLDDFPDLSQLGITLQGMGVDDGWEQRVW
jgi:abortive infection bacteriophage resistance protein